MEKLKNLYKRIPSSVIVGILLVLITTLAAVLRFYHIGKLSFWNDEIDTFIYAKESFQGMLQSDPNMSLYYSIAHFWVRIFPGASEGLLRTLSVIFSVASIPVVYLLGSSITKDKKKGIAIGLIAALLVSLNAFHIQYAQEFRSYSLVFLLGTLSTFLLIKAIEDPGPPHFWGVWYTIVTAAALYSHFFVVFLLGAQVISLIVLFFGNRRNFPFSGILRSGLGIIILTLPIISVALSKGAGQISWIPNPTIGIVKNFIADLTGNHGGQPFQLPLFLGGIGLLTSIGVWRQKELIAKWKLTLIECCLFLPVVMILTLSKTIMPIFMSYYLLYIMPYLAILTAVGIVTLTTLGWSKNRKLKLITVPFGLALLVLTAIQSIAGIQSYYANYQKENWRDVAQFLSNNCSQSLRLYYLTNMEKNVIFYNSNMMSQLDKSWINTLKNNPTTTDIATSLPNKFGQVCLVISHIGTPNENQANIIKEGIQIKFPKLKVVRFYGVEINIFKINENKS